jgi:hypothetical protein
MPARGDERGRRLIARAEELRARARALAETLASPSDAELGRDLSSELRALGYLD